ncbi:MAG TPA: secretin N-terminal domain-containing protein [Fibrobacteria bacterium]|nr:secretin N-terminal domain-containing protein [Fibrobacteria bacterium]
MSRNLRSTASVLSGIALAAGLGMPGVVAAQDSSAISRMKPGAGKAPIIPVLEFTNTDVRSVFRLLSEYSAVDIVVDPAVTGTVNTVVTNKSWQEVVHIVAKMMNLTITNELGYLYAQKTEDYQKRLLEKASQANAQDQAVKLQRKIVRVSNAKADEMEKAVKELSSPRGKITVVPRTNSLIIVDGPEQIAAIEKVIRQLDQETNQVLIEAKLVQVESNALQELGVNWQLNSGGGMGLSTNPSGLGSSSTGMLGGGPFKGAQVTTNTSVPGGTSAQTMAFGLLNGNLGVAISHLLQTGKAEVLATPQITTLDNKEARIFMGDQVPLLSRDLSGNTVVKYVDAGTELTVTPQITAPDRVLLNLKPKKNGYILSGTNYIIKVQEAQTDVVVTDGETVVIGGLVERKEELAEVGVPLLKDIPLLGALFRYTHKEIIKKDLAIFVTPRIVRRQLSLAPQPAPDPRDLAKAATAPSAEPAVAPPSPPPPPEPVPAPVVSEPPPPPPPAPEPQYAPAPEPQYAPAPEPEPSYSEPAPVPQDVPQDQMVPVDPASQPSP